MSTAIPPPSSFRSRGHDEKWESCFPSSSSFGPIMCINLLLSSLPSHFTAVQEKKKVCGEEDQARTHQKSSGGKKSEASFPLISSHLLLRYGVPLNFFHSSLRSQEIRGKGEDSRKSFRRSVARQECALVCRTKNNVEKFALFLSPSSYFTFAARQTGPL